MVNGKEGMYLQPIMVLEQLRKVHRNGDRPFLFSEINTVIKPQDSIALLGVSGQGKTTLLRVLARLEGADGGELKFHNVTDAEYKPTEWRKRVCYVPQMPVMLPETVEDNLQAVSRLHQEEFDRDLAQRLMNQAGLAYLDWTKHASQLSGGEKQRLQLIRSLLLRPEVVLLDEVTSSLDMQSKTAIEQLLIEWNEQEGTALVWVTHDLEQARRVSKRVWFLSNGQLLEDTQTDIFFEMPSTSEAIEFLGMDSEEAH
jgi:putative ABC transport system ATP-binding protein